MNYRAELNGTKFITTDNCRFVPLGVPDLFQHVMAPANYMETVNTLGKPFYAKMDRTKFDKGVDLEVQSNPLMICNRPGCLIKGTET